VLHQKNENNLLFEQVETEYERQEHLKKSFNTSLKDLKDFYELCVKCQNKRLAEDMELLRIETRWKEKSM